MLFTEPLYQVMKRRANTGSFPSQNGSYQLYVTSWLVWIPPDITEINPINGMMEQRCEINVVFSPMTIWAFGS